MSIKKFNDRLSFNDSIGGSNKLWTKTEIIGGHGFRKNPKTGLTELDEVLFKSHNTVVIGGVQYAMQNIFGVNGPITIPTLYTSQAIGLPDVTYTDRDVAQPDGNYTMPFKYGNRVTLFGIGLSGYGGGENTITKYDVDYRENMITQTKTASDGTTLDGLMIPFRYTTQTLSTTDQLKYFGKSTNTTSGYTSYYLKRFESEPVIHHYWNTSGAVDGSEDDATEITDSDVWDSTRTTPVQSLTEIQLTVSDKDVKDYFELDSYGQEIGEPRFNTIALFDGVFDASNGDYRNVRMFSKLYIPNENLSLSKDLDLVYRVYGA